MTFPDPHKQPLNFSMSTKGLIVTGGTNSADDLHVFIEKLSAIESLLRELEREAKQ